VRGFLSKRLRVSGQDSGFSLQSQFVIGPEKTFEQPAAEEARAAGDEKSPPAKFFPEIAGVREDVVEVVLKWVICRNHLGFRFWLSAESFHAT